MDTRGQFYNRSVKWIRILKCGRNLDVMALKSLMKSENISRRNQEHIVLNCTYPSLTSDQHRLLQNYWLSMSRVYHGNHLIWTTVFDFHRVDTNEYLLEMFQYNVWLIWLSKDFEQIVVVEKIKPWKVKPFCLEKTKTIKSNGFLWSYN